MASYNNVVYCKQWHIKAGTMATWDLWSINYPHTRTVPLATSPSHVPELHTSAASLRCPWAVPQAQRSIIIVHKSQVDSYWYKTVSDSLTEQTVSQSHAQGPQPLPPTGQWYLLSCDNFGYVPEETWRAECHIDTSSIQGLLVARFCYLPWLMDIHTVAIDYSTSPRFFV